MVSFVTRFLKYQRGLAAIRKAGIWFVDIPRTASSSIRTELAGQFGDVYGKSDLNDASLNVNHQLIESHLTAREMRQLLGRNLWDKLFTFSFVRNPWARMYSLFQYRKAVSEIPPSFSFEQYLELFFQSPDQPYSPYHYHGYYYQALDYLTDESGEIIVDFIGRFEDREHDLKLVRDKCSFPGLGYLKTQESIEPNYRPFYSIEAQDMISTIFKKDIEAFQYDF